MNNKNNILYIGIGVVIALLLGLVGIMAYKIFVDDKPTVVTNPVTTTTDTVPAAEAATPAVAAAEAVAEPATEAADDDSGMRVIVDGVHVRLRWGPSTDAAIYSNSHGHAIYPRKGQSLTYLETVGDWYKVKYKGHELYISSDFCYLR